MSLAAPMKPDPIEAICQQGCQHVLSVIDQLEQGVLVDELSDYGAEDCQAILAELKAIMAVYDFRSCSLK